VSELHFRDFFRRPVGDQVAARHRPPRTQVHNVVGAANRLFVGSTTSTVLPQIA